MAYTKTNWVDRVVDSGGTVQVEGTPVNAANMNKIENAIEALQSTAYKITLASSSWSGSGPYTYTYPASGVTSDMNIYATVDSTVNNLNGDLTVTAGSSQITFSTPSLPSGNVVVTVMILGADAGVQWMDWSTTCYSKDQTYSKSEVYTKAETNSAISQSTAKSSYWSLLLGNNLTSSYAEINTYDGRKISDYLLLVIAPRLNSGWFVNSCILPVSSFNGSSAAVFFQDGSNTVEVDVKYVSDTVVQAKYIGTPTSNVGLYMYGVFEK